MLHHNSTICRNEIRNESSFRPSPSLLTLLNRSLQALPKFCLQKVRPLFTASPEACLPFGLPPAEAPRVAQLELS